jgi:hypothetical protein
MKITEFITESRGGMSKRWLEAQKEPMFFLDAKGNKYQFANLVLLPLKVPKLPVEEFMQELTSVADQIGVAPESIQQVNKPGKTTAGMLIVMKGPRNKIVSFIKYFRNREMDVLGMHWTPADFAKETGLTWQETRVTGTGKDKKAETITRIKLKPNESVPTNVNLAISSVPAQSKKFLLGQNVDPATAESMKQLLVNAYHGRVTPVPGTAPFERDIRVDFGEVASPLALTNGKLCGGKYGQVASELLAPMGCTWQTATEVFYPAAGNEPLYDSQIMWPNGEKLRISNKAEGKGGAASTVSILEVLKRYPERFSRADKAMLKEGGKFYPFINAINIIAKNQSSDGAIALALEFGFIDERDAQVAKAMLDAKSTNPKDLTARLRKIVTNPAIMNAKTDLPDYKVCYHLIAALARLVVGHLNSDKALTTEFFKFMLSRANLIQVNQFTQRQDDGVAYNRFDVVWPPVFTGKILFSASDFQSNKKCGQRIAFKT